MAPVPSLPLLDQAAAAGFPTPAADHAERRIDLTEELVRNPAATFLCRVAGDSMRDMGVFDGDLAIVDRSIDPRPGMVVVAVVDGGLVVKQLAKGRGRPELRSANPAYPPIPIDPEQGVQIWGVVIHVVRTLPGGPMPGGQR